MSQRIKVLTVDDSVVVRRLVTDVLASDPAIEVVGTAANGKLALEKILQLKPDVVTLDIEMPVMDGLEAIKEIRKIDRRLPVIMFSTLTERGATATLEALSSGASDYVTKPANVGSVAESMESVRQQLIPKIKALVPHLGHLAAPPAAPAPSAPAATPARPATPVTTRTPTGAAKTPRALVIGSSTGGPEALSAVLAKLPATLGVPVLVTQHMPPVFTRLYAQRLDKSSALRVVEATDGEPVVAGTVYVAPGDFHMEVARRGPQMVIKLHQGPAENFCRPAVDVMLRSAVAAFGGELLAVILTGMGSDGKLGCKDIAAAGGQVLAQDEATSVVWGMPGAVTREGIADEVLPLSAIADAIQRRLGPGARTASAPHPPAARPPAAGSTRPTVSTSPTRSTPPARPPASRPAAPAARPSQGRW
ncbi:two-component system chemotaxis response regulator CheB [Kineococcus radiotolerans]|uniref:Protein-glutamate methylesterase/protein-glutamine glutaminase n=2 Tax=Kineococcus radiotolerans TaxID=131568 RepID=A6W4S2_KINRD|nr:chemotaxis response regulator protein-glutamate methylesterase [Kineococcus radiotolerans]ABS01811.1 response regulator receiver modulated CheB methylesterase [Kineococcus radiotolerans SRS30216 = ATCC BAA-149]MBB2901045.1 two-component system chemotaxis response regulator CheB [Kineococcus radiotolerans]